MLMTKYGQPVSDSGQMKDIFKRVTVGFDGVGKTLSVVNVEQTDTSPLACLNT